MSTPKPVLGAFVQDALKVGPHVLRPLNMGHFLLLERIGSPFTRSRADFAENPQPPDTMDLARALYITTRTDEQMLALMDSFDAAQFERDARAFTFTVSVQEMEALLPRLAAIMSHSTSTMIGGSDETGTEQNAEDQKKRRSRSPLPRRGQAQRARLGAHDHRHALP